jgi:hypothetical protein
VAATLLARHSWAAAAAALLGVQESEEFFLSFVILCNGLWAMASF